MKFIKITSLLLISAFMMTGCMAPEATGLDEESIEFVQFNEIKEGQETAVIETSIGTIKMVLFENEAPKTVAHFKKLIKSGFYNDKEIFINPEFKAFITGAIDETGTKGEIINDDKKPIVCEVTPNLWHFSGAVSVLGYEKNKMSKDMLSDSRFFIVDDIKATTEMATQMEEYEYPQKVIDAYKEHGGMPQYTGSYTVFGQVYEGLDIVSKIVASPIKEGEAHPSDGTKIIKIELSKYEKPTEN